MKKIDNISDGISPSKVIVKSKSGFANSLTTSEIVMSFIPPFEAGVLNLRILMVVGGFTK